MQNKVATNTASSYTSGTVSNAQIAVIGLGYVGLPLAIALAAKYRVLGFDIDKERIAELQKGIDRTREADLAYLHAVTTEPNQPPNRGIANGKTHTDRKSNRLNYSH